MQDIKDPLFVPHETIATQSLKQMKGFFFLYITYVNVEHVIYKINYNQKENTVNQFCNTNRDKNENYILNAKADIKKKQKTLQCTLVQHLLNFQSDSKMDCLYLQELWARQLHFSSLSEKYKMHK